MDADHDGSSGRGGSNSAHEDVRPQAVSHEPAGPDAPGPEAEAPEAVPDPPGPASA